MNTSLKGVAKRLIFSLVVASALGGCAVYGPVATTYTDADGKTVTVAPAVVTTPYYDPYYYPYSSYYYDPWFVGPPLYFNFGVHSSGGHRFQGRGFRSGHGGFRGGRGAGSGRMHR
ncbi:MAG: hypothetical protein Q7T07_17235 [Burkholderiaceae bacterium]|nr:hypothetical protein [Burkholderiaceae bacterium]